MACVEMKQSHQHWCLWAFISIAMNAVILSYDEQTFDKMSAESRKKKKTFIVKKSLRPVPGWGKLEHAKNMAASDPSKVTQDTP